MSKARLSAQQRAIVQILLDGSRTPPAGTVTGALRPGEIIDRLGISRGPKAYASISRSLDRLVKAGLVRCVKPVFAQGDGWRYYHP